MRGQLPVDGAEGAGGAGQHEEEGEADQGQEAGHVEPPAAATAAGTQPAGAGRGTEGTVILAVLAGRPATAEQKVDNKISALLQHLCDDGGRKQYSMFRVPMRGRADVKVYEARSFSCEKTGS